MVSGVSSIWREKWGSAGNHCLIRFVESDITSYQNPIFVINRMIVCWPSWFIVVITRSLFANSLMFVVSCVTCIFVCYLISENQIIIFVRSAPRWQDRIRGYVRDINEWDMWWWNWMLSKSDCWHKSASDASCPKNSRAGSASRLRMHRE